MSRAPRRPSPVARRGVAVVVMAAGVLLGLGLPIAPAQAAGESITTDAVGPLFNGGSLVPGDGSVSCVKVDFAGVSDAQDIGVAIDQQGSLAQYLNLVIDAGTGGAYGNCAGFVGHQVFSGTLAAFGAAHPAPATMLVAASTGAAAAGSVTFRFTVTLVGGNAAQSSTAQATVSFALADPVPVGPVIPPPDPPTPSPTTPTPTTTPTSEPPTTAPPTSPPPTSEPTTSEPTTDPTSAEPTPSSSDSNVVIPPASGSGEPSATADPGSPSPSGPPGSPSPTPGGPSASGSPTGGSRPDPNAVTTVPLTPGGKPAKKPHGPLQSVADSVGGLLSAAGDGVTRVAHAVSRAAAPTAKGLSWTLIVLPLIALFLMVQHRFDRLDPKLAEAPANPDPDLSFEDTYSTLEDADSSEVVIDLTDIRSLR